MTSERKRGTKSAAVGWLLRYGLALVLFGAVLGLSLFLRRIDLSLNLTIPIIFAMVVTAWWGGLGPGLLLSVLFQGTTILYGTSAETNPYKLWFSYLSVFALYVFLAVVISNLRKSKRRVSEQRDLLQVTLSSIGDGVVTTDVKGRITFMNPVAEELTGWTSSEAGGRGLDEVIRIINEDTRQPVVNPVDRVLETGTIIGLANHSVLVSRSGHEIPIDDSAAPIKEGNQLKGVVLVFSDVTERKLAERARRETEIMHRLVEAQEAERHRIARDLHDHLGQKMTALRLKIESLVKGAPERTPLSGAIDEVQSSARLIDRDISFLSWELRPTELEELGLENAVGTFVREWSSQYGIPAEFHAQLPETDGRLSKTAETNLYRIVQEGLNNVLKHADAKNVSVLIHHRNDHLSLIIEDDGMGFERHSGRLEGKKPGGLGIIGMRERTALLNGTLEIEGRPGEGTTVLAKIPLNQISNFQSTC